LLLFYPLTVSTTSTFMSKKIKTMRLSNFEDVDVALLEIGRTESVVAKKEAEMNSKIQQLKEKYDAETETERRFIDETKERIENFCMANKTDFDKQRTMA
jgi:phage host-nuclease inhibitor protein Gam